MDDISDFGTNIGTTISVEEVFGNSLPAFVEFLGLVVGKLIGLKIPVEY
jgi:hypothetical protein